MRYGTIANYFPDKKFGFIRPDVGQDIFFHISALDGGETQSEIKCGQPVKYELMSRREAILSSRPAGGKESAAEKDAAVQPKAKVVALIDKLPGAKLAEFRTSQEVGRHQRARQKKPTWRR